MKKVLIGLLIAIIGVIIAIILIINKKPNKLEFVYKTNGGVPYRWEYIIRDKKVVKYVKSYEVEDKNKNGMVGAPIKIKYVFKGLKEGKTVIVFKYVNITNGTFEKIEKHTVKVDKNKNIKLIKTSKN